MSLLSIIEAINEFAGPIATNRILAYLEGDKEILKPWIWILWLGAGPILSSVCQQTYLYFSVSFFVLFGLVCFGAGWGGVKVEAAGIA